MRGFLPAIACHKGQLGVQARLSRRAGSQIGRARQSYTRPGIQPKSGGTRADWDPDWWRRCARLNATIRGVARSAFSDGVDVLGVRKGGPAWWAKAMPSRCALGTCGNPDPGRHDPGLIAGQPAGEPGSHGCCHRNIGRLGMDALVTIGGDDTLSVGAALAERGVPVVGVPKTVDNDLLVTEYCIGFDIHGRDCHRGRGPAAHHGCFASQGHGGRGDGRGAG